VPNQSIDLNDAVDSYREARLAEVHRVFGEILDWLRMEGAERPLHRIERELLARFLTLGCALVALWWSYRRPPSAPGILRRGGSSYAYAGESFDDVRTRFGEIRLPRSVYCRVSGSGAAKVSPADRLMGLAPGRMSLGVHLFAAWLYAQMPFERAREVMLRGGGYAPSNRSGHGIIDEYGPMAREFLETLAAPADDGEVLVIVMDDKGVSTIDQEEHRKRCRPHEKLGRGTSRRNARKLRKRTHRARRKSRTDPKNARMAKVAVVYTLHRLPDGSFEGPVNRRVLATFKARSVLVAMVKREARLRGYPGKRTLFLADGSKTLWNIHREHFPEATACADWFHVCEYISEAGSAVHKLGSAALHEWVAARHEELRQDRADAVLGELKDLRAQVGKCGPGTRGRRERIDAAIRFLGTLHENRRLPYKELLADGLEIGTGVIEGVIKHLIGSRLDGCGMRWVPMRAEQVLALRLVQVNDVWDEFEEYASTRHEGNESWTVPRITPKGPQDVDHACLEAA
jgi:hypothetical protein